MTKLPITGMRYKYERISDGRNTWYVDALFDDTCERITVTQVWGDVTDLVGLETALRAFIARELMSLTRPCEITFNIRPESK
jgi:hypothetical protein